MKDFISAKERLINPLKYRLWCTVGMIVSFIVVNVLFNQLIHEVINVYQKSRA